MSDDLKTANEELTTASLCFLSYKRPDSLFRAIKSALDNSGRGNYEVILHDDGSDSNNQERITSYFRGVPNIDLFIARQPERNEGVGAAIKTCFSVARGDVLIKLDQDLIFKEDWLVRVMGILNNAGRIALLGLFHYYHDPVDCKKTLLMEHEGWEEHTHICGSGFAMPRRAYDKFGISTHSAAFAEDWDLMNRIRATNGVFCNALPNHDLVSNAGFGIGPSTVVMEDETVRPIHKAKI